MNSREWQAVTTPRLLAFAVGAGLFFVLLVLSEPGFVPIIDHANLLFHEAGHPILGLLVPRLEPYGGTLGQLAIPFILMLNFWQKRQTISVAACAIWFFENFLNIARYMADASAMQLPLVGGGDHDWNTIFSRWQVLHYDLQIAAVVRIIGWLGMLATCAWVCWRAYRNHRAVLAAKLQELPHPS